MPPEILVSIDVRVDVLKSFYLLPSLMYRLESLMLASQIREEINGHYSNFYISSSLVSFSYLVQVFQLLVFLISNEFFEFLPLLLICIHN